MRRLIQIFTLMLLGLQSIPVNADLLVLVHGYLGSAASWQRSGVSAVLAQHGWQPGGVVRPEGIYGAVGPAKGDLQYAVDLPSLAPLALQAELLARELALLAARYPGEPMVLIGHSAGGVVARLALVLGRAPQAKALITIAAPHLGTMRAVQALDETDDPFPLSWMKSFMVGDIYDLVRDSRGVLIDLAPARPGSLLYWLNVQPHPEMAYISIIRPGPVGLGDELVPAFSQDMNSVAALAGRAEQITQPTSHQLNPVDGQLLVRVLQRL
ncbi:esterase/lipase family protein [endosymbiont of Riftia pachyptila]|uniref:GPI inositol-deacylase PGAP1-like alpha/beta domain-containing protein n=1 Tax=endosymbiont of Riftia pachyptila (vent Ph05) TaxID=1048808 RepID=G2DBQ1_9GAMM|nr:alpha/beta fold hydrolase [endosymbiont of Riftia pachyptila]EGV51973.1 hypothetical protein Rifp1Sym_at00260 [endosymbiont of Riftia pachyptila (vent Ph05)]